MKLWGFVLTGVLFLPWLLAWGLWLLLALVAWPKGRKGGLSENAGAAGRTKFDILIPAHNEERLLPKLLASLQAQTKPELVGTVLVVADHCSDGTAALAREAGVSVLERNSGPRGKPGAVRDGLAWLDQAQASGTALLLLDADCVCSANLVEAMAGRMAAGPAVVQAAYSLSSTNGDTLNQSVHLGFMLKNVVRPRGASRLGLPCQLFGTGMAFRKDVLQGITFEDHLIEDLRISHSLVLAGVRPAFVAEAQVMSPMPEDRAGLTKQRLRWEGGQTQTWRMILSLAGGLLQRGDLRSLVALIDWSAPPMALAVMGWFAMTVVVAVGAALGWVPTMALVWPMVAALLLAGYLAAGVLAISGLRGLWHLLLHAPSFLLWKAKLYLRMARGQGATTWERTPRAALPPLGGGGDQP